MDKASSERCSALCSWHCKTKPRGLGLPADSKLEDKKFADRGSPGPRRVHVHGNAAIALSSELSGGAWSCSLTCAYCTCVCSSMYVCKRMYVRACVCTHIVLHCTELYCTALCGMVRHGMVWYDGMFYCVAFYGAVCTVRYRKTIAWHCVAAWYCVVLYCVVFIVSFGIVWLWYCLILVVLSCIASYSCIYTDVHVCMCACLHACQHECMHVCPIYQKAKKPADLLRWMEEVLQHLLNLLHPTELAGWIDREINRLAQHCTSYTYFCHSYGCYEHTDIMTCIHT